ncbi:unnamed protein product [Dovyalis caffra]|uniref:NAC domain-containing protein n=1 Tax=Dovyalis caffra TaxID=77055 RepID=A0AAV1RXI1_9ROSI|nr:unnamed protein product [Dovyalis caffra]
MDTVPPGFRFYPTEEELVSFYLRNKLEASRDVLLRVMDRLIPLKQEFSLCRVYKKSKFVRAFDRRPLGVETGEKMRAQAAHGADEATTSHQNPSTVQITCSHDSSSLEDHGQPFQTGESSNVAIMDVDTEPIWDWAQLDWELK